MYDITWLFVELILETSTNDNLILAMKVTVTIN